MSKIGNAKIMGCYRNIKVSKNIGSFKKPPQHKVSAMDYYTGIRFDHGYIEALDVKTILREEVMLLQDELSDWPDGETRTITYRDAYRMPDNSWRLVEKTETMTKNKAESLVTSLENKISQM